MSRGLLIFLSMIT